MKRIDKRYILSILLLMIIVGMAYSPLLKNMHSLIARWGRTYILALPLSQGIFDYHQFPLRTHLFEGGYPFIGDIESWDLSPFGIFICLFGGIAGVRIITLSYFLIGALGMFYFARNIMQYCYPGAIFSSVIYIMSSWAANRTVDSNLIYLCSYFMPWAFAFFIKSFRDNKYIIFTAIILSLYIMVGGLTFIIAVFFIFLYGILDSLKFGGTNKIIVNYSWPARFVTIIILALLISAIKAAPMINLINKRVYLYFHNSPQVEQVYGTVEVDQNGKITKTLPERCLTFDKLYKALFKSDFTENYLSIYFGYIPVIFLFLSLIFYPLKLIRYLLLLIIFIILMFGPNSPIDLYKSLWEMNFITRAIIKIDKYFLPYIVFLIALMAGQALSITEKLNGRKKYFCFGILFFLAVVSVYNNFKIHQFLINKIKYKQVNQSEKKYAKEAFFQVEFFERPDEIGWLNEKNGDDFWFFPLLRQNIGIVNFYPTVKIGSSAIPKYFIDPEKCQLVFANIDRFREIEHLFTINPKYKGEAFFLQEENKSNLIYFSPNKIVIDTYIAAADNLIFNQNYHQGWISNKGKVNNYSGFLAVGLSKKDSGKINLIYLPADFLIGFIISVGTLLGILFYLFYFLKQKHEK